MTTPLLRLALSLPVIAGFAIACASGAANTGGPRSDPAVVTGAELEASPNEPVEKVLQSKVSGVLVRRTADGGIALQIRGATSFDGSDAPLFLIDDMPFEPGPGGVLTGVDPYSILAIKVLKGADAGIYGIRGANGVILITTKRAATRTP